MYLWTSLNLTYPTIIRSSSFFASMLCWSFLWTRSISWMLHCSNNESTSMSNKLDVVILVWFSFIHSIERIFNGFMVYLHFSNRNRKQLFFWLKWVVNIKWNVNVIVANTNSLKSAIFKSSSRDYMILLCCYNHAKNWQWYDKERRISFTILILWKEKRENEE